MNLVQLSDRELHLETQTLVSQERQILTKILHHLREIERRRLFADFGCTSLFDYAVKMLGYSEGQAQRRIQAMRLMKEIPEIEKKIVDGSLNLSNIAQAQTAFNEMKRQSNNQPVTQSRKKEVLSNLENMSAREGQRQLLKMLPEAALPKEREREVGNDQTEIKFLVDENLKNKLEEIRSLLGPKGVNMSNAELFSHMAEISLSQLKGKAFGKKRAQETSPPAESQSSSPSTQSLPTPTLTSKIKSPINSRYVPASLKHAVWRRDGGRCSQCKSRRNLNLDHIVPIAMRGTTKVENLRLLCFHCNQRAAIKEFGLAFMNEKAHKSRHVTN
jgi:5-methylcytosine-specific restriction endonuclease McrA